MFGSKAKRIADLERRVDEMRSVIVQMPHLIERHIVSNERRNGRCI